MIPALLRGKLSRDQENMEDILTSIVFGQLQYVSPEVGLLNFLSFAVSLSGEHSDLPRHAVDKPKYEFWPWWKEQDCEGAEPDVVIHLTDDHGVVHVIVIEVKFQSGKSSYANSGSLAPTDQLAREWDNLVCKCEGGGWKPHLVYLTAEFGYPREDIVQAASEFAAKRLERSKVYPFEGSWLSWRHIPEAFGDSAIPILLDLFRLSQRYGFDFFRGFAPLRAVAQPVWRFASDLLEEYAFLSLKPLANIWKFNADQYAFSRFKQSIPTWRFTT